MIHHDDRRSTGGEALDEKTDSSPLQPREITIQQLRAAIQQLEELSEARAHTALFSPSFFFIAPAVGLFTDPGTLVASLTPRTDHELERLVVRIINGAIQHGITIDRAGLQLEAAAIPELIDRVRSVTPGDQLPQSYFNVDADQRVVTLGAALITLLEERLQRLPGYSLICRNFGAEL